MVAHFARILFLVLFPLVLWGQSLELSVSGPTQNNTPSTFLLENGEVTINSTTVEFLNSGATHNYDAIGVSPDLSVVAILSRKQDRGEISVLDSEGTALNTYSTVMLSDDDPSLAVYPLNNGSALLQDNITNFTFYDVFGEVSTSTSSSGQSDEGEMISEISMDPNGKTVIIYSPKIKRDSDFGSNAQLKITNGKFEDIFYSSDRFIKNVNVSDDGNMIAIITAQSGSNDQAVIMDKYGNELQTLSTDENLLGASFSSDNEFVSLYADGRVMVHSVLDGSSLGATSFNSTVFLADYFPEDNVILALTGTYSEGAGVLNNVEFRAIHLEKRSITSESFSGSLGFTAAITPKLNRLSANEYKLSGASKEVRIEANF